MISEMFRSFREYLQGVTENRKEEILRDAYNQYYDLALHNDLLRLSGMCSAGCLLPRPGQR